MNLFSIDLWIRGMDDNQSSHCSSPSQLLYHNLFHKSQFAPGHPFLQSSSSLQNPFRFITADNLCPLVSSSFAISHHSDLVLLVLTNTEDLKHQTSPRFTRDYSKITFTWNISHFDSGFFSHSYATSDQQPMSANFRGLWCSSSLILN